MERKHKHEHDTLSDDSGRVVVKGPIYATEIGRFLTPILTRSMTELGHPDVPGQFHAENVFLSTCRLGLRFTLGREL